MRAPGGRRTGPWSMTALAAALALGFVAGLRTFTALAAVSLAAWLGWLDLSATALACLGQGWTLAVLLVLAAAELVGDKLSFAPSRKRPGPFAARLASGALCGAAVGATSGLVAAGMAAGVAGAISGALLGFSARARLAARFHGDAPAAALEDAVAIVAALAAIACIRGL